MRTVTKLQYHAATNDVATIDKSANMDFEVLPFAGIGLAEIALVRCHRPTTLVSYSSICSPINIPSLFGLVDGKKVRAKETRWHSYIYYL